MMYIVRRDFHEEGVVYNYELDDGTKLHFKSWDGNGYRLKEKDADVRYVPIENPFPLDKYGEPDYYDVIGFDKTYM